jgi:hypothetical protein
MLGLVVCDCNANVDGSIVGSHAEQGMIPSERRDLEPAGKFDAREAARRQHPAGRQPLWPQLAAALAISLCLWAVILLGLAWAVLGWS